MISARSLAVVVGVIVLGRSTATVAQAPANRAAPTKLGSARQLTTPDVAAWKQINSATLSSNGEWLGYLLAPNEGNQEAIFRATKGGKEYRFPAGESGEGSF